MKQNPPDEYVIKIRVWGSLNIFLPPSRKYRVFSYQIKGHPSVKDTIEAVGVPHTEIDGLLINGRPVDFFYQLKEGDHLEAYPYGYKFFGLSGFTLSDCRKIKHLSPSIPSRARFVVDSHLGKLARHLRLLGFDSVYKKVFPDSEILQIALREKRIVLTRDIGLLKNKRLTHGYWLHSADPQRQIKEVLKRFDLELKVRPFQRCLECNGRIVKVAKKRIIHLLAADTRTYFRQFYLCRACEKVYWQGSHYDRLKKLVDSCLFSG